MRDIKFRGITFDDEWIHGYYFYDEYGDDHYIIYADEFDDTVPYMDLVDPETVGQYTGLKDKNGTEIYEGDIYHQGDKNIKYLVVWNDTGLIGKQVRSSSYAGLEYWKDKIEVMGNIHENPELL